MKYYVVLFGYFPGCPLCKLKGYTVTMLPETEFPVQLLCYALLFNLCWKQILLPNTLKRKVLREAFAPVLLPYFLIRLKEKL